MVKIKKYIGIVLTVIIITLINTVFVMNYNEGQYSFTSLMILMFIACIIAAIIISFQYKKIKKQETKEQLISLVNNIKEIEK